jgi:hypothetical protein
MKVVVWYQVAGLMVEKDMISSFFFLLALPTTNQGKKDIVFRFII